MENTFEKADELTGNIKEYVNTRIALIKIEFAEKTSALIGKTIAISVVSIMFLVAWLMLNITFSLWLEEKVPHHYQAFLITAGINAIIGLLVWWLKDPLIRIPIMNSIIAQLFKNEEEQ